MMSILRARSDVEVIYERTYPHWRCCRIAGWLIAAAWIVSFGLPRDGRAQATFMGLGRLAPDSQASAAYSVSGDGSVVVGRNYDATNAFEAWRWTAAGGMQDLGTLGATGYADAQDVSLDGSVVVGVSGAQAFRWTPANGMIGLGTIPGDTFSAAFGVSADGSVVVGYSIYSIVGLTTVQAARWTAAEGMVGLGDLGGGAGSQAYAVSDDGSVIVGRASGTSGPEAFRWTAAEGMVGLGHLPGLETQSAAYGVSSDGSVVVGESDSPGSGHAFRWTAAEGMQDLGLGRAQSVSADGSIVVGWSGTMAVIWDAANRMRSVQAGLTAAGADLRDWSLDAVWGISPDGNWIVGTGFHNGPGDEAWLATLPPPPQCSDGIDNDGDGLIDLADPDCAGDPNHPSESPACSDGIDNDGDGLIDFDGGASAHGGFPIALPDPGCLDANGTTESPACQDGIDNDGDGGIDFDGGASANGGVALGPPDLDCWAHPARNYETVLPPLGCGLGAELSIVVPILMWIRQRRRLGR